MFVFKAAVVGAGTMGGEIAQVVAAAGVPVVLKDVKQEFVDHGLEKAREVTQMGEATNRPHQVVGFHFFYPASTLRLIEVIEGDETSEETMQSAANFAQQIRKQPIRCGEAPGFVVNRVLNSAVSEIWRVRDEEDAPVEEIDKVVTDSKAAPMGPFFLGDLLGLDTVLHVAEHLNQSFGDRFYVSPKMKELVEAGNL